MTAASASGICDGAGALVLASEAAVKKYGLKPLAELVSWANVGVDPTRMGIGFARPGTADFAAEGHYLPLIGSDVDRPHA